MQSMTVVEIRALEVRTMKKIRDWDVFPKLIFDYWLGRIWVGKMEVKDLELKLEIY